MSEDFDDAVAAVTYDHEDDSVVVVIGSGAGGGTLANELAQKGIDVVLIEAGPRINQDQLENDPHAMAELLSWSDKRTCTGTADIATDFAEAPTWVCKAVGGSTLHWTALCIRLQDFEFKARSVYGEVAGANLADWPIGLQDLATYYDKAEDKMGVSGTNGIPAHPPSNNYKVLAAGARRIGYTSIDTGNHAIIRCPATGAMRAIRSAFVCKGASRAPSGRPPSRKFPGPRQRDAAKSGRSAWRCRYLPMTADGSRASFTPTAMAFTKNKCHVLCASPRTESKRRACS